MFVMDILEFAINMEIEGNKYYMEQAEANKDNGLYKVFIMLAEDENKHADIIKHKKEGGKYSSAKVEKTKADTIFEDKDQKVSEITLSPEQVDAYRFALDKEQESIDLYTELKSKSKGDEEMFDFLIEEETKHFNLLSEVVELLTHAKQWVESAEFGVREEY